MAFAPVLDGFCNALKCSNTSIALACGMSSSTLSRYRNGKRTPNSDSDTINQLAQGIASLAREHGINAISSQEEVAKALKASLAQSQPLGMGFAVRLDSLMHLLEIRNAEVAQIMHLDSSYISRIRHGERMPANKEGIAEITAQIAAIRCMENDMLDDVLALMGVGDMLNTSAEGMESFDLISRTIRGWLLGSQVTDEDMDSVLALFSEIDSGYYEWVLQRAEVTSPSMCTSLLNPTMQFYRGEGFIWKAELGFLAHALECGAKRVTISSDMPAFETLLPDSAVEEYQEAVADLAANECEITIIHSIDRSLRESIRAMKMWIPLYMTGHVAPLYLSGMTSQLFCHTNSVCECCAMASEAIRGYEKDGQYFLSTRPEDIAYYQKKMDHIRRQASVMLEVYRDDAKDGMAIFERSEEERRKRGGREVCAGQFQNLKIVSYASDCVVLSISRSIGFHFVIRHPKVCYVVSHLR